MAVLRGRVSTEGKNGAYYSVVRAERDLRRSSASSLLFDHLATVVAIEGDSE